MTLTRANINLRRRNINLSNSNITKRLHDAGYKQLVPLSKSLLSEKHRKKRLEWCKEMIHMDWNNVVFSYESTFSLTQYKKRYWTKGTKKILRRVKHPQKIHAWGCFSSNRFGKLYIFKKILNANLMVDIYNKALPPSLDQFSFENRGFKRSGRKT